MKNWITPLIVFGMCAFSPGLRAEENHNEDIFAILSKAEVIKRESGIIYDGGKEKILGNYELRSIKSNTLKIDAMAIVKEGDCVVFIEENTPPIIKGLEAKEISELRLLHEFGHCVAGRIFKKWEDNHDLENVSLLFGYNITLLTESGASIRKIHELIADAWMGLNYIKQKKDINNAVQTLTAFINWRKGQNGYSIEGLEWILSNASTIVESKLTLTDWMVKMMDEKRVVLKHLNWNENSSDVLSEVIEEKIRAWLRDDVYNAKFLLGDHLDFEIDQYLGKTIGSECGTKNYSECLDLLISEPNIHLKINEWLKEYEAQNINFEVYKMYKKIRKNEFKPENLGLRVKTLKK